MSERLLTSRELGELLGFSPATIVDWAEAGTVPAFKLGGRLRFRESEVEAWLEANRKRPDAEEKLTTTPRASGRGVVSPTTTTPQRGGEDDA